MDADFEQEKLPFQPFDQTLKDVLRHDYMVPVSKWILGTHPQWMTVQEGNSAWEAALALLFLSDLRAILIECNENPELVKDIQEKSVSVCRWLLSRKNDFETGGQQFTSWEQVTWDTSVIVRALITCIKQYEAQFTIDEKEILKSSVTKAARWLLHRFSQWETQVKYPFGPADVSQIVLTLLCIKTEYPDVFETLCQEHKTRQPDSTHSDPCVEIVEYLLHKRTEKTLTIEGESSSEEQNLQQDKTENVLVYWWDDYFSTAEVVEALAAFYNAYKATISSLPKPDQTCINHIPPALIRACVYFEHNQVDGMWGSHIDTLKVLYAYTRLRDCVPQSHQSMKVPLIVPEIHTTFKALRWICDRKQIFTDGSMLHTSFLTIFYAMALMAVYRYWEPANRPINQLYDDVLWFSPVRTTPERLRRLNCELRARDLEETAFQLEAVLKQKRRLLRNLAYSGILLLVMFFTGLQFKVYELHIAGRMSSGEEAFWSFVAVAVVFCGWIWRQKSSE